jgi:hypothetical protein
MSVMDELSPSSFDFSFSRENQNDECSEVTDFIAKYISYKRGSFDDNRAKIRCSKIRLSGSCLNYTTDILWFHIPGHMIPEVEPD